MKPLTDIAVYSPDDRVQLVVEVKSKKGATDEWAAKMRRNLLVHAMIPRSQFFLLALPEYFYLWRHNPPNGEVPADYKIPTADALRHYLDDIKLEDLSKQSLELLVSSWLNDLITARITKEGVPEASWLFESGLYDRIRNGSVKIENAV